MVGETETWHWSRLKHIEAAPAGVTICSRFVGARRLHQEEPPLGVWPLAAARSICTFSFTLEGRPRCHATHDVPAAATPPSNASTGSPGSNGISKRCAPAWPLHRSAASACSGQTLWQPTRSGKATPTSISAPPPTGMPALVQFRPPAIRCNSALPARQGLCSAIT